ncbi:DNA-J related domain-containing protein [uncultured Psychromonas sp.]|uniref:DNA-J related domain-containing protein n=1 Tax=uncultured Psychromonas sp. TaxID=173974 RepID=UPI00261A30B4|nr:DNA-J related domain-containing protein [uncultured Psychromonas sp.]
MSQHQQSEQQSDYQQSNDYKSEQKNKEQKNSYHNSRLLKMLKGYPQGIKEYDLLTLLQQQQCPQQPPQESPKKTPESSLKTPEQAPQANSIDTAYSKKEPFSKNVTFFDNLDLFQKHFLLFHALYKLNDQLQAAQEGMLIIEALNIQFLPAEQGQQNRANDPKYNLHLELANNDPLRDYYLDIENLHDTSSEDVDNLLDSFWLNMGDNSEKDSALALLDLQEPCDLVIIKKRYRQLLAKYHPDKGGCVETTKALNDAMSVLKRCYPA